METYAQDQYSRAVRDETEGVNRRNSLQKSIDRQAKEAWSHLSDMHQDTEQKTGRYRERIEADQTRLREQHDHQGKTYDLYDDKCT